MANIRLNSLYNYYNDKKTINKLLEVLSDNNKISLRIIDWFVTNYSKEYNTTYPIVIKRPNGSDIRKQFIDNKINKVNSVIFTHEHSDQINGLFELRPFTFSNKNAFGL